MTIFECNLRNETDKQGYISLLSHYMSDTMGDHPPHTPQKYDELVEILDSMPHAFVIVVKDGSFYCAMATCFVTFSTFAIAPVVNIHDFVVHTHYRNQGIGKKLISYVSELATSLGCAKITLEVRDDNITAQHLYHSQGFFPSTPQMLFWEKSLSL